MNVLAAVRGLYEEKRPEPVYIGDLIERLGGPGDKIRQSLYALAADRHLRAESGGWVPVVTISGRREADPDA